MDERITKLYEFVEKKYKGDERNPGLEELAASRFGDTNHGFDHIKRVFALVQGIGPKENGNMLVLEAAALLHDIAIADVGDESHARAGAEKAREMLAQFDFSADEANRICEAIRQHSTDDPSEGEKSLEGEILFDSDKLDVLGAIGFLRFVQHFRRAGVPIEEVPKSIKEHVKKWKDKYGDNVFFTKTAQEISKGKFKQLLDIVDLMEREMRIEKKKCLK